LGVEPIYETLLSKIISTNNAPVFNKKSEKIIKSFIISYDSDLDKKKIKDIDWGKHCLIVTVDRGEESITPNGDVVLRAGDEVVFLISQRRYTKDINHLEELFGK
jgi:Trk K+ transport system NAD-binding subunit